MMASDKPSFAKVATTSSTDKEPQILGSRFSKAATPSPKKVGVSPVVANGATAHPTPQSSVGMGSLIAKSPPESAPKADSATLDALENGIGRLIIKPSEPADLIANGSASDPADASATSPREGSEDSQKGGSELGTKPSSLDGKSIISGATFAMDEKESLRPDDSASVKAAAVDDDDAFSVRGSLLAASRMGSDLAARARGLQLGDAVPMPTRGLVNPIGGVVIGSVGGLLTPQSSSPGQPGTPGPTPVPVPDPVNLMYGQNPDDKLLEAMKSARERIFLLRLENQLINFVQNSKEPYMDVREGPEQFLNGFYRMLAHRLADYYHMTHSYEPTSDAVRIFRTPFCRVPSSLSSVMAELPSTGLPPPQAVLPKKIMRRGEDRDAAGPWNGNASKTASDTSGETKGKPSQQPSHKPSRSEREEAYKVARERIFGSMVESEANEDDTGVSRANSVPNRDKNSGKRGKGPRQRRDSDGFEPRNHFYYYGGLHHPPTWGTQPQYPAPPPNGYYGPQMQPGYPVPPAGPMHGQPYPGFSPPPMQHGPYPSGPYPMPLPYAAQPIQQPHYASANSGNGNGHMVAYGPHAVNGPLPPPPPPPPPSFPTQPPANAPVNAPMPAPVPMNPHMSPCVHLPTVATQANAPTNAPTNAPAAPYPNRDQDQGQNRRSPVSPVPGNPYPFGQLPSNPNPKDPKSQHPIPGSYNRHTSFNPKIQSFVPGNIAMPAIQPPQPPFTAPGSHHGSPQMPPSYPTYPVHAGFQQQPGMAHPPPPLFPAQYNGPGYGMVRQTPATAAMPPYHASQHAPPQLMPAPLTAPMMHPPPPGPSTSSQPPQLPATQRFLSHSPNLPNKPSAPQALPDSHLPSHGTPANLPPKPDTGM